MDEHSGSEKINAARWRGSLRALRIIVRNYFVGKFRATAELLLNSNNPIDDIANLYGESLAMTYRRASYVSTVMQFYLEVSRQKWRKRITRKLVADFGEQKMVMFYSYAVHLSVARAMSDVGINPKSRVIWYKVLARIESKAATDADYAGLHAALKRTLSISRQGYLTDKKAIRVHVGNYWGGLHQSESTLHG